MTDYNYNGICDYIDSRTANGSKGLDLACGTGKVTNELAYRGYKMVGIDKSIDMLNVASHNAISKGLKVPYIQGDITNTNIESQFDFVIATCDVINYIRAEDINNLFSSISKLLKKDGIFILDYSTSYKLLSIIGNNVFYEDNNEFTYIWTNTLDNSIINMDLVFFIKDNNLYRRYDESHTQYIHFNDNVLNSLINSDFVIAEYMDGDKLDILRDDSSRIIIRAVKGNGQNR